MCWSVGRGERRCREVCWGEMKDVGKCGGRMGKCGGRCEKMCWGAWEVREEVERGVGWCRGMRKEGVGRGVLGCGEDEGR